VHVRKGDGTYPEETVFANVAGYHIRPPMTSIKAVPSSHRTWRLARLGN